MREEEKETNTTPQNQVSLSLLKSVWCSFLVALFCRGCGCGGKRALVSLSLVSFAAEKNVTGDLARRDFFFLCLGF